MNELSEKELIDLARKINQIIAREKGKWKKEDYELAWHLTREAIDTNSLSKDSGAAWAACMEAYEAKTLGYDDEAVKIAAVKKFQEKCAKIQLNKEAGE